MILKPVPCVPATTEFSLFFPMPTMAGHQAFAHVLPSVWNVLLQFSWWNLLSPSQPSPNVHTFLIISPTSPHPWPNCSCPQILQHFSYPPDSNSSWICLSFPTESSLESWYQGTKMTDMVTMEAAAVVVMRTMMVSTLTVLFQKWFHWILSNKRFMAEHPEDREESVTCSRLQRLTKKKKGSARIWKHILMPSIQPLLLYHYPLKTEVLESSSCSLNSCWKNGPTRKWR